MIENIIIGAVLVGGFLIVYDIIKTRKKKKRIIEQLKEFNKRPKKWIRTKIFDEFSDCIGEGLSMVSNPSYKEINQTAWEVRFEKDARLILKFPDNIQYFEYTKHWRNGDLIPFKFKDERGRKFNINFNLSHISPREMVLIEVKEPHRAWYPKSLYDLIYNNDVVEFYNEVLGLQSIITHRSELKEYNYLKSMMWMYKIKYELL
jgi:hypothetical protein